MQFTIPIIFLLIFLIVGIMFINFSIIENKIHSGLAKEARLFNVYTSYLEDKISKCKNSDVSYEYSLSDGDVGINKQINCDEIG